MTDPRVLCLGELLNDRLADRPGATPSAVASWTDYSGGAPANVACAISKLDTPAGFIGCVGSDALGDRLLGVLAEAGVNIRGVQRHLDAPTRQVYVLRSESGDRTFGGFGDIPPDAFADAFLQADKLPVALFESAEFLVLGTLELAYPMARQAVLRSLELAVACGLKIVLDVNARPTFWPDPEAAKPLVQTLYPYVDYLKLAREEALWLFDTAEAAAIAYQLDSVEGVLVTDGAGAVSYYLNTSEGKYPAYTVAVQDTTGAGDAFVAGFVKQLCDRGIACLEKPEVARAVVAYACAAGALTAMRPGAIAAQPTADEVRAFLVEHEQVSD
ncbi:sugar kinase, ribokinase family [Rubidibacter lacunae KORDI 51-2]|uniref:Sugar kinase, ribokinase family n=1 Tax=Rubidibacter lacunae KORDI 51-2 TaxID=582515 RepID=U5DRE6_9CHRO|nr:carbohydrate kinase [Rubidibacter lacunae]ERN42270.1 sugar kinase, ribokinase family [Rubidibacter lacunae KORDI 51-2]